MYKLSTLILLVTTVLISGCNPEARGFALPPGDAEAGRLAFTELGCNSCHSVRDASSVWIERQPGTEQPNVVLGGETTYVRTYGELVTSIIHPSHKLSRGGDQAVEPDGQSRMKSFNDVMTVQQMIDLTTMLQHAYSILPPRYTYYAP